MLLRPAAPSPSLPAWCGAAGPQTASSGTDVVAPRRHLFTATAVSSWNVTQLFRAGWSGSGRELTCRPPRWQPGATPLWELARFVWPRGYRTNRGIGGALTGRSVWSDPSNVPRHSEGLTDYTMAVNVWVQSGC